ncbi:MAG: pyridoxamine 5'-phosphate oxidase [Flavobacteriales bacterium]|nr:pyridoxamine 5'-phosphate oxidase [Flavobacteriales bacterium]
MEELRNYINSIRRDFMQRELNESSVEKMPIKQFAQWMAEAVDAQILDPHAMVIATANSNGKPSVRTVYIRDFNESGIIFYTNFNSRKGKELAENVDCSVLFLWEEVERQIRIEGKAEKVAEEISDAYFASRPRESQIGAWASQQSEKIKSREELEKKQKEYSQQFEGKEVPRPPHWGGYIIKPEYFEFWQGRPNRLHDRIVYEKKHSLWEIYRLNP